MRVVELQNALLTELAKALGERGYRYIKKEQHFRKKGEGATFYFHIAFIQHASDVDATADVAVTYHLPGGDDSVTVGVELGTAGEGARSRARQSLPRVSGALAGAAARRAQGTIIAGLCRFT